MDTAVITINSFRHTTNRGDLFQPAMGKRKKDTRVPIKTVGHITGERSLPLPEVACAFLSPELSHVTPSGTTVAARHV
ncbi:hypothetical protein E2C01_064413 [Portunus trituberculatus]|uniref:Uncharacterized protein n=1 Tax=Portunus trituberculatus TaxID=210409 RepID=A0A5B7HG49_PORTR|nr:hypothetical protein [Portunus trituberculatus]